jgi:hypothetical protein
MRWLLLFICLLFIPRLEAQHVNTAIDTIAREQYVQSMVKHIMQEINTNSLPAEARPKLIDVPDFQKVSYRIQGKTMIRCTNGQWIYLLPHSGHNNPTIGDVSIAVTSKGKVCVNYSHICGGLINFASTGINLPTTPADFFSRFVSDTDDEGIWIKWK